MDKKLSLFFFVLVSVSYVLAEAETSSEENNEKVEKTSHAIKAEGSIAKNSTKIQSNENEDYQNDDSSVTKSSSQPPLTHRTITDEHENKTEPPMEKPGKFDDEKATESPTEQSTKTPTEKAKKISDDPEVTTQAVKATNPVSQKTEAMKTEHVTPTKPSKQADNAPQQGVTSTKSTGKNSSNTIQGSIVLASMCLILAKLAFY